MSQQQDMELLNLIRKDNNVQAKEELVKKYLPMVRHIVKKHYSKMLDFDDCVQEGAIGLLNAIHEYDPLHFPIKFSTFAYICILRKIYNVLKQIYCKKAIFSNRALSLNMVLGEDESNVLMNVTPVEGDGPFEEIEQDWIRERVDIVLRAYLSPVEHQVIQMILGGHKFLEIQKKLSLSGKAVDNARTRARFKLKKVLYQYGSLLSPQIPLKTRKRKDLSLCV